MLNELKARLETIDKTVEALKAERREVVKAVKMLEAASENATKVLTNTTGGETVDGTIDG